jgi:prevent-host-death family protein
VKWKLAEAKQQLSKVVRLSQREPQILQNRNEAVAAVVSVEEYERFREWRDREGRTLQSAFEELRRISEAESWELELAPRADRPNPFVAAREPRRAKR